MAKDSDVKKLIKIAANQQKIINGLIAKLAQELPNAFPTNKTTKNEQGAIWKALPLQVSAAVNRLEVHGNVIKVQFKPGKASDANFKAVQDVVQELQMSGVLSGSNYTVQEVA